MLPICILMVTKICIHDGILFQVTMKRGMKSRRLFTMDFHTDMQTCRAQLKQILISKLEFIFYMHRNTYVRTVFQRCIGNGDGVINLPEMYFQS